VITVLLYGAPGTPAASPSRIRYDDFEGLQGLALGEFIGSMMFK